MKKVFFLAALAVAVIGAVISGGSAKAQPALEQGDTTIECDGTPVGCAQIGPVFVYGKATIKPAAQ